MTVRLVDFEQWHRDELLVQERQLHELKDAPSRPVGQAWGALVGDHPICIGGLYEIWRGRAYAWALLGRDAGPHMVSLTRAIRFQLDAAPFARIEMVVEKDFRAAARWAVMLGYELETPVALRCFLPSGRDAWIYSRIK
jgi:hypothetical protein